MELSEPVPPQPQAAEAREAAPERARRALGGHLPVLDGVRGLAILMVLLYHFVAQTRATNVVEAAVNKVLAYGALGVDLFFILSGFLITGILYEARADERYFRNFYMRRVLRIFPLYYAVLAVVFFVVPLIPSLQGTGLARLREHQAWAWPYGVNVYLAIKGSWALGYIQHFWSLAVEEHFYFVWPLVVWLLAARPRVLMRVTLAVALASFGARMVASLMGVNEVALTVLTPFQLDALCLGGFFALLVRQPDGEEAARGAILPMALVAVGVLVLQFGVRTLGFDPALALSLRHAMFRLLLGALLLGALFAPTSAALSRFFRSGPMIFLGKYSYGLYVYHHLFSYYFETHATEFVLETWIGSHTVAVVVQSVVGIALSALVSWLSYEFFEKYFLQLKRYWESPRRPAAHAA